ncbi:JAB1/Mov34/MPN/PAD-1 ubiquitin protease-domain-containing protein [Globomyces pollinis-pini]|nr:JAB1/Mov34/MPN/PAD-1 ubiquitin protease-domain-containing protein [Globomyces pollinis-pini]
MKVLLASQVHLLFSTYALSNESEEVAAMMLGSVLDGCLSISDVVFCSRKDKRKDRVEISNEQLMLAMEKADSLGLRVLGWMHSHPKITVLPSHVDLKTQLSFQALDANFVGIIYSCFHENQNKSFRTQTTAFQSILDEDQSIKQVYIPLQIVPSKNGVIDSSKFLGLLDIPAIYMEEESEIIQGSRDILTTSLSSARILKIQTALVMPLMEILKHRLQCCRSQ